MTRTRDRTVTWFAIAGGLGAWTAQLLASYALIDFACARGTGPASALVIPLLTISALCAVAAAAAAVLAALRALPARGAGRALYLGGALLDMLSLVTIVFGAPLGVLFDPCAR